MSFKTRTKLSDLLKPLREPSQTSMVSLSVVMCIFATLGLLSYFAPILDEMEENRMPLLTANRDEVSNSCQVVVHSDLWALAFLTFSSLSLTVSRGKGVYLEPNERRTTDLWIGSHPASVSHLKNPNLHVLMQDSFVLLN